MDKNTKNNQEKNNGNSSLQSVLGGVTNKKNKIRTMPENYEYYGDEIMSNCDREVDKNIEQKIKNKPLWAGYAGWDFYGLVWWENNKWYCMVKQYRCHIDTIEANTPEKLMEKVSDEYGYN